ncbi:VOC family protein [Streptomyces sp. NA02950]|uniref:VOC family protein n=1 Tax=Streptomyces sp. NA02950 TaxID=2742137 RepID=UPI001591BB13|nr:VOC family protein [Streptomyces sp. NA02950]QKV95660.1 VOC family protein [Streptomyces sp. NA02950]
MSAAAGSGPTICPTLLYRDAKAAIALLTEGFGFTEVAVHEDAAGVVQHAELAYGNGVVMLGSAGRAGVFARAMKDAGPTGIYVAVDDVDAHHRRAERYGVQILMPPTDQDYGARDYLARDGEGNLWSFGTYVPGTAG